MTHPESPDEPSSESLKAGRREWVGLAVLALGALIYVMDLTVLHLAVPRMTEDLQPTSAQLLWIIDIYGFMVAGFLVTMGTLGDRIGRRRLLLIGAAGFGAASIMAAVSNSPEMLILSRALLGIAGATLAPATLSLIFNMFRDPGERTRAVAIWISAFSAGSGIGPVLGGIVLEHFAWGVVFLLALPPMALLLVLGPILLPEYRDPEAGRLDLMSAAMSLVAVLAVIFGLKQVAQDGISWVPIVAILVGLAVGALFVRRQFRLADPMLDLGLFRVRAFSSALTVNFLTVFVVIGYFLFVAQYMQLVVGLSPFEAGLWSVPSALAFVVGSNLAPRILSLLRPAHVIGGGLLVAGVGLGILALVNDGNGLAAVIVASVVISLGLAPGITITTELVVGSAPPERAGAASGVSETAFELGGALGISILGSIGIAVYRSAVADGLPAGIPADAAAAILDTLGGAVATAAQLPPELGTAVLALARTAFVDGMQLAALISTAFAVVAAVLAVVTLGQLRTPSEGGDEGSDAPEPATEHGVEAQASGGSVPVQT